jgi:hypothetical protein
MSDKFDRLAKGMAESVTRRQALRRFGLGLAGMALTCFGPFSKAASSGNCLPSGSFCGNGVPHENCGRCCSGSHFCIHSEDVPESCFCN